MKKAVQVKDAGMCVIAGGVIADTPAMLIIQNTICRSRRNCMKYGFLTFPTSG